MCLTRSRPPAPASALNLTAATRCYELALAAGPDLAWCASAEGIDALTRLCKQLSDQGWHAYAAAHGLPCARHARPPPGPLSRGLELIVDAVALAEEALALAPNSARVHTTMAVASGRLALFTDNNRQRVALCNRIRAEAEAAVALDPRDDVAHHALGRWHAEVAGLNPVVRIVMRHMYGGDVQASHAEALAHYTAACELAPQRLTHRTELGKVRQRAHTRVRAAHTIAGADDGDTCAQALMKLGRRREALLAFKAALTCDVEVCWAAHV